VTHRALDLFVAGVTDQDDVLFLLREANGLAVHLGDEGAGGVDRLEAAVGSPLHDARRHAVRAEDDVRPLRHLVDLVDEDRPLPFERRDDVHVVHDLLADVDGRAVVLEGLFDGDHRPVDASAVAAGGRQEHTFAPGDGGIL